MSWVDEFREAALVIVGARRMLLGYADFWGGN